MRSTFRCDASWNPFNVKCFSSSINKNVCHDYCLSLVVVVVVVVVLMEKEKEKKKRLLFLCAVVSIPRIPERVFWRIFPHYSIWFRQHALTALEWILFISLYYYTFSLFTWYYYNGFCFLFFVFCFFFRGVFSTLLFKFLNVMGKYYFVFSIDKSSRGIKKKKPKKRNKKKKTISAWTRPCV